ncbi:Yip1 family protein [Ureibacillus sp. MALMAid1270]|uniref:Yip1 family protein n=1 Tax=Ureibacillus sp. MALMAid1270 TaxID=3411629 RepID=UPI003BA60AB3
MKNCFACGNVQETGNFCAKCGGTLTDVAATNNVGTPTPNQNTGHQGHPGQPVKPVQPAQPAHPGNQGQPTPNFQQPGQPPFQQPPFQQQGQNFQQQPYQQNGQYQQPYQQAPAQPNVHVERVKDQSKMFFSYFGEYLKSPSTIFGRGESQFVNGIISIVLYAIIFGLSLFFVANQFVSAFSMGAYNAGSQFFQIFFSGFIAIIILVALVIVALLIINKLFGPDVSFKELISNYGALIIPSLLLLALAAIFLVINVYNFAMIFFMISLFIALIAVPLYMITRLLGTRSKTIDPFYAYILYIVLFSVFYYILNNIFLSNTIGQYMNFGL